MRLLPNVVGVLLLIAGCAWSLAGLGYISDTSMSDSYLWTGFGFVAALAGWVLLVSANRARFRLSQIKRVASK
jgi:hypothetical protein